MKNEAYQTIFHHLSEMKEVIGQEIGLSAWMEITQAQIDTFAKVTDDEQWIHVDPKKSKDFSPYGTTVAHGFFVLSLASKFAYEMYQVEDAKMVVNYGLDRVRFPNATPVGAHLRGRLSLLDYEEKPGGARVKLEITFELKGQEKPACVAQLLAQFYI